MSKIRRFAVPSLEAAAIGLELTLPESEAHHVRVLRLTAGYEIELNDAFGRVALAEISSAPGEAIRARVLELRNLAAAIRTRKLTLATAWPKGKRSAIMVEKCAELGVDLIVPLNFERSVVSKDDESEGISRLKRVSAEASKQSGRAGVMSIGLELTLRAFLSERAQLGDQAITMLLDPRGDSAVHSVINGYRDIACIVGPEGGFTADEIAAVGAQKVARVRLAEHILRIETAAIAAASVIGLAIQT